MTKGIIKSINFNSNTCEVRIPLLETAAQNSEIVITATFAIIPGIYNSYKVNDVVWVGFENNKYENAVILGKLFISTQDEKNSFRGALSVESLEVKQNAILPVSTKLGWDAKDKKTVGVDGDFSTYKTLGDVLKRIKTNEDSLNDAKIQIINNGEDFGVRVSQLEKDDVRHESMINLNSKNIEAKVDIEQDGHETGFGWNLDNQSWHVFSYDSEHEVPGKDILTITDEGMTLCGDLKIEGYPHKEEVKYAKNQDPDHAPANINSDPAIEQNNWEHGDWDYEQPQRQNGYYIWSWTRKWNYVYDDEDKRLKEYINNRIFCITGQKGDKGDKGDQGDPGADGTSVRIKGSKPDYSHLPTTGLVIGDGYILEDASDAPEYEEGGSHEGELHEGILYMWDGVKWTWCGRIKGDDATEHKLSIDCPVHSGTQQEFPINVNVYTIIGNDDRIIDNSILIAYKSESDANWTSVDTETKQIPISAFKNEIMEVRAYVMDGANVKIIDGPEKITYSPLNTPTIDLDNDVDFIKYTSKGKYDEYETVQSVASLWLNHEEITTGVTYYWTLYNCTSVETPEASGTYAGKVLGNTITISELSSTNAKAVCSAIYDGEVYESTFKIKKDIITSMYSIEIANDKDFIPCDSKGNSIYTSAQWISETTHTVECFFGDNEQPITRVSTTVPTSGTTGYTLYYNVSNTITFVPGTINNNEYTARLSGMAAEAVEGQVLYILYKDTDEVARAYFKAKKQASDGVDYSVISNVTKIVKDENGNYSPNNLTFTFNRTINGINDSTYTGSVYSINKDGTETFYNTPLKVLTINNILSTGTINYITVTIYDRPLQGSEVFNAAWKEAHEVEGENVSIVADGTSAVSYWLSIDHDIHYGDRQTENVTIIAKKKVGISGSESNDEQAKLYYRFGRSSSWTEINSYTVTIDKDDFVNQDLEIKSQHGSVVINTENIAYIPREGVAMNLTRDSAALPYDGNDILTSDGVATTASFYINGELIPENTNSTNHYTWTLLNCDFDDDGHTLNERTITITDIDDDETIAYASCTASYTKDGTEYTSTKIFTITKQLKGDQGDPGDDGEDGRSVTKVETYFCLTSHPPGSTIPTDEDIVGDPGGTWVPDEEDPETGHNTWSLSPMIFDDTKHVGYKYYEAKRIEYDTYESGHGPDDPEQIHEHDWELPINASMVSEEFINAFNLTAKRITVINNGKILLDANSISENPYVKLAHFTVSGNTLESGDPASDKYIKISSGDLYGDYLCYVSQNQNIDNSMSVAKITFNRDIDNITLFAHCSSELECDSILATDINPSSVPTSASDDTVLYVVDGAWSEVRWEDCTPLEYQNIHTNDFIYILYLKDNTISEMWDAGRFFIPKEYEEDITIEDVTDDRLLNRAPFKNWESAEAGDKFMITIHEGDEFDFNTSNSQIIVEQSPFNTPIVASDMTRITNQENFSLKLGYIEMSHAICLGRTYSSNNNTTIGFKLFIYDENEDTYIAQRDFKQLFTLDHIDNLDSQTNELWSNYILSNSFPGRLYQFVRDSINDHIENTEVIKAGQNFKVYSDGRLYASDATIKGCIEADSGKIGSFTINEVDLIGGTEGADDYVKLSGTIPSLIDYTGYSATNIDTDDYHYTNHNTVSIAVLTVLEETPSATIYIRSYGGDGNNIYTIASIPNPEIIPTGIEYPAFPGRDADNIKASTKGHPNHNTDLSAYIAVTYNDLHINDKIYIIYFRPKDVTTPQGGYFVVPDLLYNISVSHYSNKFIKYWNTDYGREDYMSVYPFEVDNDLGHKSTAIVAGKHFSVSPSGQVMIDKLILGKHSLTFTGQADGSQMIANKKLTICSNTGTAGLIIKGDYEVDKKYKRVTFVAKYRYSPDPGQHVQPTPYHCDISIKFADPEEALVNAVTVLKHMSLRVWDAGIGAYVLVDQNPEYQFRIPFNASITDNALQTQTLCQNSFRPYAHEEVDANPLQVFYNNQWINAEDHVFIAIADDIDDAPAVYSIGNFLPTNCFTNTLGGSPKSEHWKEVWANEVHATKVIGKTFESERGILGTIYTGWVDAEHSVPNEGTMIFNEETETFVILRGYSTGQAEIVVRDGMYSGSMVLTAASTTDAGQWLSVAFPAEANKKYYITYSNIIEEPNNSHQRPVAIIHRGSSY